MPDPAIPVIATGKVFSEYLAAARKNLDALHRLAVGLKDDEFARIAQRLLDSFDDEATDAHFLIAEANG